MLALTAAFALGWLASLLYHEGGLSQVALWGSVRPDAESVSTRTLPHRMPSQSRESDAHVGTRPVRPGSVTEAIAHTASAVNAMHKGSVFDPQRPLRSQGDVAVAVREALAQMQDETTKSRRRPLAENPATAGSTRTPASPVVVGAPGDQMVGTQGEMLSVVRAALEQDREERDRHERALRDGPYGDLNYDVNWMSERVQGLTAEQKRLYAQHLDQHRQTLALLDNQLAAAQVSGNEYEIRMRLARDTMNQVMRQVLNGTQYDDYLAAEGVRRRANSSVPRTADKPAAGVASP